MSVHLDRILSPTSVRPSPPAVAHPLEESGASRFPYKRAPKACTQCRRDKSRCDRGRPCNGCIKKSRVESCLDGCVACRQRKLRCDEGRPCQDCCKHERECVEDDLVAIAASRLQQQALSKSAVAQRMKPTPRTHVATTSSREKSARLACRRDNKKCAGGETCPRCVRRDEDCTYLVLGPKFVGKRCAPCRERNRKCDKARPCRHCVKADVRCIDLPRKSVGHGRRVKRACAGCRAEKIQCQAARPCARCKRKKVNCVEQPCKACLATGTKCEACREDDHFRLGGPESSDDEVVSPEEADSAFSHSPSPSLPRRIRPRHPRLSSPSRLPTSIDSESHCVPAHNRTVPPPVTDAPPNGSSVLFGTDNDTLCPTFHLAPDARLLHSSLSVGPFAYSPALRPGLSADYRIPLSLTTSTSHVRTRPSYDTED